MFYKPYESRGQAWPLTFVRLIWGIVIFQIFMIGILTLRQCYIMSSLLVPLVLGTVAWSWYIHKTYRALSNAVCLSSVCEVERGEEAADFVGLREGHPVTWSQRCGDDVSLFGCSDMTFGSNLSRRRYAQNDETLYVAPEDERTDYVRTLLFGIVSSDFDVVATTNGKLVQGRPKVGTPRVLVWRVG